MTVKKVGQTVVLTIKSTWISLKSGKSFLHNWKAPSYEALGWCQTSLSFLIGKVASGSLLHHYQLGPCWQHDCQPLLWRKMVLDGYLSLYLVSQRRHSTLRHIHYSSYNNKLTCAQPSILQSIPLLRQSPRRIRWVALTLRCIGQQNFPLTLRNYLLSFPNLCLYPLSCRLVKEGQPSPLLAFSPIRP